MFRKTSIALAAAAAVLCLTGPVSAETFTASNGVLSIELPNENWKEITDPAKWIALSDGNNLITIEHYSNGEKLPEIAVADSHYVDVYQAAFSTQNEVFIITGSVVDAEKIPEIANAIVSTKVLRFDTKLAVKKESDVSTTEFSINPMDKTMYVVSDGLNVRSGCATTEPIIGGYNYGASVKVTGQVLYNGADYGWYQIAYGSGTGYVASGFLSETAPEQKDDGSDDGQDQYSGTVKTVYDETGAAYTLYEGLDGLWRTKDGKAYTRLSDTEFQAYEGTQRLFVYNPAEQDTYVTVFDEMGNSYTLYEGSDGFWRDNSGTAYQWVSDYELQAYEGTKRLSVFYPEGAPDNNDYSDQELPYEYREITAYGEDGNSFTLYLAEDGYWYDFDGRGYSQVGDDLFKAVDGNKYVNVIWD